MDKFSCDSHGRLFEKPMISAFFVINMCPFLIFSWIYCLILVNSFCKFDPAYVKTSSMMSLFLSIPESYPSIRAISQQIASMIMFQYLYANVNIPRCLISHWKLQQFCLYVYHHDFLVCEKLFQTIHLTWYCVTFYIISRNESSRYTRPTF